MVRTKIPFDEVNFFSQLVNDYLSDEPALSSFYNRSNKLENYQSQIIEKQQHPVDRELLVKVLKEQNKSVPLSEFSLTNINLLLSPNSFTITTGHQLCLFSGPLYVIYKIISTIKLAKTLRASYPKYHFVPVFWLASEDHDFDEINHINIFGRRIEWKTNQTGPVGKMALSEVPKLLKELKELMGEGGNAERLMTMFESAYKRDSLAQASRFLVNELFKEYGLLIIDGDDPLLKSTFVEVMKKDIIDHAFYPLFKKQSDLLSKHYHAQAHFRKVNFFELTNQQRKRLTEPISESLIYNEPGRFSPNVLMRPLYQEKILPNLAYIGGGAEVAYWMQLKTAFETEKIPFPILVLRPSALLIRPNQLKKLNQLGLSSVDLFQSESTLHKSYVYKQSELDIENESVALIQLFDGLKQRFNTTAQRPIIDAEYQRQSKALEKLHKKLIKIEKQNHQTALTHITKLKSQLFPNGNLQERHDSFIPYFMNYGDNFMKILNEELNPLDSNFVVLSL